jgi:hypothetical protein
MEENYFSPPQNSHYSPAGEKQLSDFVKGHQERSRYDQSITSGTPFTDPNTAPGSASSTRPSYSGGASRAPAASSSSAAVSGGGVGTTSGSAGGSASTAATETSVSEILSGFQIHMARTDPADHDEPWKIYIQEGAAITSAGTQFIHAALNNETVPTYGRSGGNWENISANPYWYLEPNALVPGGTATINQVANSKAYQVFRPFGGPDAWSFAVGDIIDDPSGATYQSGVDVNNNPIMSPVRVMIATYANPTNIDVYANSNQVFTITWNPDRVTAGLDQAPSDPRKNSDQVFLIASMRFPGGNQPLSPSMIYDRRNFDADQSTLLRAEYEKKALFLRASVPTTEPRVIVNAPSGEYGPEPVPGVRGGRGIKPSIVIEDGLPVLRIDLDATHVYDGSVDPTQASTGTLVFNITTSGLSAAMPLPAHCASKIVNLVVEDMSEVFGCSILRKGLDVHVYRPKEYSASAGTPVSIAHIHEYEDDNGTDMDTKDTEEALTGITIPGPTTLSEGTVTAQTVTVRWILMN